MSLLVLRLGSVLVLSGLVGCAVLLGVWADVGRHMRTHLDSFTLADMVRQARGLAGPVRVD